MAPSMETNTPSKPQATLSPCMDSTSTTPISKNAGLEQEPRSSVTLADSEEPEFDPFSAAKPCSPFYVYNHDPPRSSTDTRLKQPGAIHVSVHNLDLEKGHSNITPTSSRTPASQQKTCNGDQGLLKMWTGRSQKQCMTKPKQRRWTTWMASLSKWQRLAVKLLIGMALIGTIVGIAVGISIRVHGGVYKSSNQSSNIGS